MPSASSSLRPGLPHLPGVAAFPGRAPRSLPPLSGQVLGRPLLASESLPSPTPRPSTGAAAPGPRDPTWRLRRWSVEGGRGPVVVALGVPGGKMLLQFGVSVSGSGRARGRLCLG
ncbi:hypothetical protein NDU88_010673 [Pleurodeles waltl]|uniref:Uncharacterized protein n=1 Tax=Pleurodeles waltl TaxID=8319 RepID=A0AAV7RZZ0_PLEWA|nr:hypothetical protein NDU88_010673 [Pleurodeles waltl]